MAWEKQAMRELLETCDGFGHGPRDPVAVDELRVECFRVIALDLGGTAHRPRQSRDERLRRLTEMTSSTVVSGTFAS